MFEVIERTMSIDLTRLPQRIEDGIEEHLPESLSTVPWTRSLAAGSLVASAILLISGRRKTALAVALGGGAVTLLENPDAARDLWNSIPRYIRNAQDLLVKSEDFITQLAEQGEKLRRSMSK